MILEASASSLERMDKTPYGSYREAWMSGFWRGGGPALSQRSQRALQITNDTEEEST